MKIIHIKNYHFFFRKSLHKDSFLGWKYIHFIFYFQFLFSLTLSAQTSNLISKNNVIGPSPTAASLGKYAEWPVSLYTGTTNISIPLYTLSEKNISVPISLSYHASGNRVDDYASWVGLGWTLNCGGVITRTVRGLPDDNPSHGYFATRTLLRNPERAYDNVTNFTIFHNQALGMLDSQPDVFMFNALGQSFKFFIDSNFNIQSIPKSAIKVSLSPNHDGVFLANDEWKVELENGTKLYFGGVGAVERTQNMSNGNVIDDYYSGTGFVSSWFLKRIVSVTGEVINFHYEPEDYTTSNTLSFTDYTRQTLGALMPPEINLSESRISGVRLSRIESSNQLIKFVPQPASRLDLTYCYALDSLKVYESASQKVVKQLSFNYGYSESSRLTLDHINEISSDHSETINQYGFLYSETKLPVRGSYAQDHWGYYNGANNQTLLPYVQGLLPSQLSADREAHFPFSSAEILTQINYPTGGSSKFIYEPHSYTNFTTEIGQASATVTLLTTDPLGTEKVMSFNKSTGGEVKLNYSFIRNPQENDPLYVLISIKNLDNGTTINRAPSVDGSYEDLFLLQAGNYTISVRSIDMANTYCTATVSWTAEGDPHPVDRLVGGVRIKEIIASENNQVLSKKKFIYENAFCAAPYQNEHYAYVMRVLTIDPCIPAPGETYVNRTDHYLARTSYSKTVLGTTSGGPIGYGKVTVLNGDNGDNGLEENYFSTSPSDWVSTNFPFPPPSSFDYKRGLLLNQITKDASGKTKKEISNTYDFIPNYIQQGYVAGFALYNRCYDGSSGLNVAQRSEIIYGPFINSSEWVQQTGTREDIYDDNGNISSVLKKYYYDNPAHLQMTRSSISNSTGKTIVSLKTFAQDYGSGTPFIDNMKNNHQIALPIEEVSYEEDTNGLKILGGNITEYSLGAALPNKVYQLETDSPILLSSFKFSNYGMGQFPNFISGNSYLMDSRYKQRINYNKYSTGGNLLEVQTSLGPKSAYLWSYNSQYPIAEIKNADYATVESVLGGSASVNNFSNSIPTDQQVKNIINQLRNSISLKDAHITSYTYKPLVGMTSQTDAKGLTTTYEYDAFQRLSTVRDQNGNILKQTNYHYKN